MSACRRHIRTGSASGNPSITFGVIHRSPSSSQPVQEHLRERASGNSTSRSPFAIA
jgi:hypothetical protein